MALKKQVTTVASRVSVDYPELPRVPAMKISEDHAAMQAFQKRMDDWYYSFRQVHNDKLSALQTQIDSIKKGL